MKKWIAVLLAGLLSLTVLPAAASAEGLSNFGTVRNYEDGIFADVPSGAWYRESLRTAYERGLMVGRGGGIFDPEGRVTLAEVITVAARIHAIYRTGKSDAADRYDPGSRSGWYAPYVRYCADWRVIHSEPEDPTKPASRAMVASVLANALPEEELAAVNAVADNAVPDVEASPVTAGVYRLYRAGVLTGMDETGAFQPLREIKRCELAAILCRMILPTTRRSVTGLAGRNARPIPADAAAEILRDALIEAYENTYGPFVPLEKKPGAGSVGVVSDKDFLAWVIPRLAMTEETPYFYVFPVIFPFWVDKYSGAVFKHYNGIDPMTIPFDPESPDALGFAG